MRGAVSALERAQFLRPAMAAILIITLFLALTPQLPVRADATEFVVTWSYHSGEGTLRWAIGEANANPGHDTITFDTESMGTATIQYDGTGGDGMASDEGELVITDSVNIVGPGSPRIVIQQRQNYGDPKTRILHIMGSATEVNISGLGFYYGQTPDADPGTASENGGAIYNETADLTLTDCYLYTNTVGKGGDSEDGTAGDGGCGGAVYCAVGSLTITDCLFMYNKAGRGGTSGSFEPPSTGTGAGSGGDGGAVYFAGDSLAIENSYFGRNESGYGGWLELCVDDSSGGPGGSGGAIYATGCTATMTEDCQFVNNVASSAGGQSYDDDEGIPEPAPPGMNGLGAVGGHGGAMYVVSTALTLEECTFERNFAGQGGESLTQQAGDGGCGGALYADGGSVAATECDFWDNEAGGGGAGLPGYAGAGGHGGAIYGHTAAVTLVACELTDSYAGRGYGGTPGDAPEGTGANIGGSGGAIYTESGTLTLSESLLQDNHGGQGGYDEDTSDWADSGNGGAVYCSNAGDDALDADRCAFVNNGYAEQGGGIYVATGTARLVNCTIGENYAAEGGGVFGVDGSSLRLSFCTVADNNADICGGGIASYSTLLRGCVVADNKLDEFGEGTAPTPPTPDDGPDIYDYTGVVGSYGGNVFGTTTGFTMITLASSPPDVMGADPVLGPLSYCKVDSVELQVFRLWARSPAIDLVPNDEGTTIDGEAVEVDQCGEPRPVDGDDNGEALWDAGAFEYSPQVFTLPSATGTGGISIRVDAGYLEEVHASAVDEVCCEMPEGMYLPHGLVGFYVESLPEDDEADEPAVVTITLTFPDNIPVGAMYWKCDDDTCEWVDVTHLLGDDDGDEVLILSITDGGEGDMDHYWSGDIEDPGGVVLPVVEEPEEEPEPRRETPPVPASMSTAYMALGTYQALPGQAVQVSVNLCNSGEVKGSQTVVLSVNGVAEQSQSLTVSGGSCKTVVFTVAKSVPGTYDVDVNGMHGQFTVLAPRIVQASVPSQQDTGLGTAGIIAIVAVMVVLVLGLVVVFRQS